jgi:hypothetical protein
MIMKNIMKQISGIAFLAFFLMSFTCVDFNKTLLGKWELKTIQTAGKSAMSTKEILGDSFMEFKSDFTYIESGESDSKGVWKITAEKYLQTKSEKQADFSEKMELKELAPGKIQITSPDKTSLVYERVK